MTKMFHVFLAIFAITILIFGCVNPVNGSKKNITSDSSNNISSTTPPKPAIEEKWNGMQMKFTYVGSQEKVIPSAGISVNGVQFDSTKFQNTTQGIDYSNDQILFNKIEITKEEMQNVVANAFDLEFMDSPNVSDDPAVSFMFYNATSNTTTEYLLTAVQGKALTTKIVESLTSSKTSVVAALTGYG